jgi:hypothetical protein
VPPRCLIIVVVEVTASGIRLTIKTPTLRSHGRPMLCLIAASMLEILFQVHPGIEVGHLVLIAIK